MKLFTDKSKCCGCGACADACPKSAITMKTDGRGFYFPVIDDKSAATAEPAKGSVILISNPKVTAAQCKRFMQ